MELLFTVILILCACFAYGQSPVVKKEVKRTRPVKVSLLSNYYGQDGDHSAVNGGSGSQKLDSYTQEGLIYIPIKDSSGVKLHGGVDYYTSASLLDIDKYQTSASTGTSRVSGDETRGYASISIDLANKITRTVHTPSFGFSKEYDVLSFNGSYGFAKFFPKQNLTYNTSLGVVGDRWLLIYPGEFREAVSGNGGSDYEYITGASAGSGGSGAGSGGTGSGGSGGTGSGGTGSGTGSGGTGSGGSGGGSGGSGSGITGVGEGMDGLLLYPKSGSGGSGSAYDAVPYATPIAVTGRTVEKDGKIYPIDHRYSLSFINSASWVINKKMNAMAGLDLVGQWGQLSTPFHRVYFDDGITEEIQKEVRIEKLPRWRVKGAVYGRYNLWINPYVSLRTHGRYYYDSWDIHAIALTAELPLKPTKWLSFVPFYRFYWQTESRYFAPYGRHVYAPGRFYTADYDLSGFISHKAGMAVRVAPLQNLVTVKNENNTRQLFALSSIGVRYAYYYRSDGLSAHIASLEINFEF